MEDHNHSESFFEKYLGFDIHLCCLPSIPIWACLMVALALLYYTYMTWYFDTFKKLGVNGPRPWPIIGTGIELITKGLATHDLNLRKYGTVVGTFVGRKPSMVIFDADIAKEIFIKQFSNFPNRFTFPLEEYALRKTLPSLKDDEWRRVRNFLTPTFSSGKLRKMNGHFRRCSDTLLGNLMVKAESGETFDFKEYSGAFTMDAIASVAFGLEIDSHNDPNNLFVTIGKKAFSFTFTSPLMLVAFFCPFLLKPMNKLGVSLMPQSVTRFFVDVVRKSMNARREANDEKETDFIQLMINARELNEENEAHDTELADPLQKSLGLSEEEVLAQGLVFFIAGFESIANTFSNLAYCLATNPDCQEKLLQEIDSVTKDQDVIDYDLVKKMTYLEMCFNETMRLYPALIRTDRITKDDVTINGVFIPKGMQVVIPIYVLHMDPEIWPEPNKFIPERFTTEQIESRNPYYYHPFGTGPRNCIGMRLAMTELKIAAATILRKLKFVQSAETESVYASNQLALEKLRLIKCKNTLNIKQMQKFINKLTEFEL